MILLFLSGLIGAFIGIFIYEFLLRIRIDYWRIIRRQRADQKLKEQARKEILLYIQCRGGLNFIDRCWDQNWTANRITNSGIQLPPLDMSKFNEQENKKV